MPPVEAILRQLGANLKRLRLQAGLGQEELAYRADLDRTLISKVENGKSLVRVDTLVKLSRGLSVPLSTLLDDIV